MTTSRNARQQLHRAMVFAVALFLSGQRDRTSVVILTLAAEVRRLRSDLARVRDHRASIWRDLIEEKTRNAQARISPPAP